MMQDGVVHEAEPRSSYVEGARDVAVLEAMLESGAKQGSSIQVKRFWSVQTIILQIIVTIIPWDI